MVRPKRRKRKQRGIVSYLPLLVIICVGLAIAASRSCDDSDSRPVVDGDLMAVTTAQGLREQVIDYKAMRVSFNASTHCPNWVSWELTRDEATGDEPRAESFAADPAVRGSADPADYRRSGYDRGHMAPAADMKWSPEAMRQSFLMTNICPQAKALNTGAWRKLEEKCRQWARADSAIVIVCGPVPGQPIAHIGSSGVAVPAAFFKVVLSPYAHPPRGIGFIMPNQKVTGGIQAAAVSIDEVERITGHDFFAALPDDVEAAVESRASFNAWPRR